MITFSRDTDLLRYEGQIFEPGGFEWQVIAQSTGTISGTGFTDLQADFVNSGIEAGMVIYFSHSASGWQQLCEIISVDSATQLTVSLVRVVADGAAVGPGDHADVDYHIKTFRIQHSQAARRITNRFGLRPGCSGGLYGAEDITDISVLQDVSVLCVLALIFASLAHRESESDDNFEKKAVHYESRYSRAVESCRLFIDTGGDDAADKVLDGLGLRVVRD